MIIWGGAYWDWKRARSLNLDSGAIYDPATDTWQEMSAVGAPSPREGHSAAWTGDRMIVWGGIDSGWLDTGAVYDPATDTWSPMSTAGAPTGRSLHSTVWTGDRMMVWGGRDDLFDPEEGTGWARVGGLYDPAHDAWTAVSAASAPLPRASHTAAWTGTRVVVWGGSWVEEENGVFNYIYPESGGAYDSDLNFWSPTPETNVPAGRAGHVAVWAGTAMVVWGGWDGEVYLASGGRLELPSPALADLSISKANGRTDVVAGTRVDYTIVASNAGPSPVAQAKVIDHVPASLTDVTWSCTGSLGGFCSPVGSGRIDDFVDLPVGASVTYSLSATLDVSARGELANVAVVAAPLDIVDPSIFDNSAPDIDPIVVPPDLSISDAPPVREGDVGSRELEFELELSKAFAEPVSVSYHTLDGTAEMGVDYTADSGEVTFEPGETRRTIAVETLGDHLPEPHETVLVQLTTPSRAVIVRDRGKGVIDDDDSARVDLDGDGRSDMLWRHLDGRLEGWLMNGTRVSTSGSLPFLAPRWRILAVADFDADGRSDILWRDDVSGETRIWLLDGLGVKGVGRPVGRRISPGRWSPSATWTATDGVTSGGGTASTGPMCGS